MLRVALVIDDYNELIYLQTILRKIGIDVEGLAFVLHHQLPDQIEYYTHRSGRTARAGKKGVSIAFIGHEEKGDITKLAKELGLNFVEMR